MAGEPSRRFRYAAAADRKLGEADGLDEGEAAGIDASRLPALQATHPRDLLARDPEASESATDANVVARI
jgi:hypothetical protein